MKNVLVCFLIALTSTALLSQESDITEVSEKACTCLDDIDLHLERTERYKKIKACITSANMQVQLSETLKTLADAKIDSIANQTVTLLDTSTDSKKKFNIYLEKDYKEIEKELLANCPRMRRLMMNEEQLQDNSVSTNITAIDLYNEGQAFYDKQDYEKAIALFKQCLEIDSKFAYAWDNLGISYRKSGDYKNAIKAYKKSLNLVKDGRTPLLNIPIAYEFLKEYDKAIDTYKKYIKIYPEDPEGYYGIGRMYHLQGDYENALDNIMKSYIMYNEVKSPYARDAESNLSLFYKELKELNKLDLFEKMAEKYKITY